MIIEEMALEFVSNAASNIIEDAIEEVATKFIQKVVRPTLSLHEEDNMVCGKPQQGIQAEAKKSTEFIWGPQDRPGYAWAKRPATRVFNSMNDNPSIGDERNFVRVRELGSGKPFEDEVAAKPGKYYEVYVYYHNNGDPDLNSTGKVIAQNIRLSMAIPARVSAGKSAVIKGTISSTNTSITSVWDSAFLTFKEDGRIKYVDKSAVLHNGGSADGQVLDGAALMSDTGAKLAYWNDSWGIIPAGPQFAGYVVFELYVDRP